MIEQQDEAVSQRHLTTNLMSAKGSKRNLTYQFTLEEYHKDLE